MSVVAWHEDVDRALMKEILNTVKIPAKTEQGFDYLPKSHVLIRKPEEDYKIEVYPSVSIYNITDTPSPERKPLGRNAYRDLSRVEYGIAEYKRQLEPYTLNYQIDFWAKFKTDMNMMTYSWLGKHTQQFNLFLDEDDKDIFGTCNAIQTGSVVHSDILSEKERLFHDIISYSIWVEIEDETVYTVNIAERVENRIHGDL